MGVSRKRVVKVDGLSFVLQGYEALLLENAPEFGLSVVGLHHEVPKVVWHDLMGRRHRYTADFYEWELNLLVEVKSRWTMSKRRRGLALRKLHAAHTLGYNVLLVVFLDSKGKNSTQFSLRAEETMTLRDMMKTWRLP